MQYFRQRACVGFFVFSVCFAALAEPTVSCNLLYSNKTTNDYATLRSIRVYAEARESTKLRLAYAGFVMTPNLEQELVEVTGAIPEAYELNVIIEKGAVRSGIWVNLRTSQSYQRYSTLLCLGDEEVLVNCDVNSPLHP